MPIDTGRRAPRYQRWLAVTGILAPAALIVGVVVAGLTWSSYDHRTQNISDLGGTEALHPALLNVTLVVFGLLVMTFAVALRPSGGHRTPTRAGPLFVGYFGAMAVVQGLTPCTPGCAEGTPIDLLHGLAATTGLLAMAIGMLSYWWATRSAADRSFHGTLSAWTGALTFGCLAMWLIAVGVDPQRLHAGVLQRVLITVVLIWLAVTAGRLHQPTPHTSGIHPRLEESMAGN